MFTQKSCVLIPFFSYLSQAGEYSCDLGWGFFQYMKHSTEPFLKQWNWSNMWDMSSNIIEWDIFQCCLWGLSGPIQPWDIPVLSCFGESYISICIWKIQSVWLQWIYMMHIYGKKKKVDYRKYYAGKVSVINPRNQQMHFKIAQTGASTLIWQIQRTIQNMVVM